VAHRLSTIRNADLIAGLHNGKVAELGTHEDLMKLQGIYYELVTLQTAEVDEKKEKLPIFRSDEDKCMKSATKSIDNPISRFAIDANDEKNNEFEDHEENGKAGRASLFKLSLRMWPYQQPEAFVIIMGALFQLIAGAANPAQCYVFTSIYTIFNLRGDEQNREAVKYMGL
jgi:hypothetical protein